MRKATVCKVLLLFHSDRPSNDEIPGKNRTKSLKRLSVPTKELKPMTHVLMS